MEAGKHHPVKGVVLLHKPYRLGQGPEAQLAGLLDLHVDAVVGEAYQQILQRGGQKDLLVPGLHALRILHVGGVLLHAVFVGEMDPLPAEYAVLRGVCIAEVHLLLHQLAVIPVGDLAGHVGLAVQGGVVGENEHAVAGNAHVRLHHHVFIHTVGVVKGLQGVVRKFPVAAAVGDQKGQLALLAHGVFQGVIVFPGLGGHNGIDQEKAHQRQSDHS